MISFGAAWREGYKKGVVEGLFLLCGIAFIATAPPQLGGDGEWRASSLGKLLHDGKLASFKYSLVGPLFASPLWALHRTEYFNLVLFVIGTIAFYFFFKPLLGSRRAARFLLFLLCASELPFDLAYFYGEPFTVITVAFGLAGLATESSGARTRPTFLRLLGCGALIVLGCVNTPATMVGCGLSCALLAWQKRDWRMLAIPIIALCGISLESYLRRGSIFASGYEGDAGYRNDLPFSGRPGFSYPFAFGLISLLFSFGRGLVFFSPGVFLRLPRAIPSAYAELSSQLSKVSSLRSIHRLWIVFVIGLVLVYAKWWAWYGGIWFGPRFLLFAAFPAGLALTLRSEEEDGSMRADLLALVAATLSLWVGFCALVCGRDAIYQSICTANGYRFEPLCWYTPEFSALSQPFMTNRHFTSREHLAIYYFVLVYFLLTQPLWRRILARIFRTGLAIQRST